MPTKTADGVTQQDGITSGQDVSASSSSEEVGSSLGIKSDYQKAMCKKLYKLGIPSNMQL